MDRMVREKMLNDHIEELKEDLSAEGVDPESALGKQLIRLTRETINLYNDRYHNKEKSIKGMTVQVEIKDTDLFSNFLDIVKDLLTDERIDKGVREEYYHRYLKEVEE